MDTKGFVRLWVLGLIAMGLDLEGISNIEKYLWLEADVDGICFE